MKGYMAIDQYGNTLHLGVTRHPRKRLLEYCGHGGKVSKQYVDRGGDTLHTGYVVGQMWYTLFEVVPFERGGV